MGRSGFRVQDFGFRIEFNKIHGVDPGKKLNGQGLGFRISGLRFRV
jgi:hypothetical protein